MPKTDGSFDPSGYATVAERIALFYRHHPAGRIETDLITRDAQSVTFRARVYRNEGDAVPAATGWATEREGDGDINTVACLENTETSSIGRALANLGYTASHNRPSREEMAKAQRSREYRERHLPRCATARVSEQKPDTFAPESDDPAYGHVVADLLTLLRQAERAGLAANRAGRLRRQLESRSLGVERIHDIERAIRDWLARRDRESDGDPPV